MTLDNPVTELEAELPESEAIAEVEQVEAEPELSITIEGEEPAEDELAIDPDDEAQLGDKGKRTLKHLRQLAQDRAKEARELKAKLAAIEAERKPQVEPPKRPTLADCGFDDDVFAAKMEEYVVSQAKVREEQARIEQEQKASEEDYRQRHARYTESRATLKVDGFDEAEHAVKEALSKEQQSIIIRNVPDAATVVYALGRSPKKLAELAAIRDLDRFAFRLAELKGEIKVTTKTPPQPETKLRGGSGSKLPTTPSDIAKLQRVAEETGDYSAYFAAKAAMRAAGVKT